MKKRLLGIAILAASAAMFAGCAKTAKTGPNDAALRYFRAWKDVHYHESDSTALGCVIIEKTDGNGATVAEEGYVYANYTITDLDGNVTSYTDKNTAKKLGEYSESSYYGPKVISTVSGIVARGVMDALGGMKVGGHIKFAVPGWLMTTDVMDSKESYENTESISSDYIYDVKIEDFTTNMMKWQKDSILSYIRRNSESLGGMTADDTLKFYGNIFYKQLKAPVDTTQFPNDSIFYINYTGRLLNGTVFDTTDEKLAKDSGIYSSSRTYGPTSVTMGDSFSEIKLGSSTVISGFALPLWYMRSMEKGVVIFTSNYGYGDSESGDMIPGYSPLQFEIEFVAKPEE